MPVIGDKLQFGTLYNAKTGASMSFPKPMTSDIGTGLYEFSDSYVYPENVTSLGARKLYGIYIGDTVSGKQMTWVYVGEMDGGETYICDRPIIKFGGSKNAKYFLNSNFYAPLEMGIAKSIVEIDGKLYYLRHFNEQMYDSFYNIKAPKGNLPVPTESDKELNSNSNSEFFKFWNSYFAEEILDLRYYEMKHKMVFRRRVTALWTGFDVRSVDNWFDDTIFSGTFVVRPALTLIGNVGEVSLEDLKVGSLVTIEGFNETQDAYTLRIIGKGQDGSGISTVKVNIPELLGEKNFSAASSATVGYNRNDYEKSHLLQWLNATGGAGEWFIKNSDSDVKPSYASKEGFLNPLSLRYKKIGNVLKNVKKDYYKYASDRQVKGSVVKMVHLLNAMERTKENIGDEYLPGTLYQLFDKDWYTFVKTGTMTNVSIFRSAYQSGRFAYDSLYSSGESYYTRDGSDSSDSYVMGYDQNYDGKRSNGTIQVNTLEYYIPILFLNDEMKVKSGNLGSALLIGNSVPKVEPESKDYGEINSPFTIEITVTDADGDSYTGTVYIDEEQKGTFSGNVSGRHTINLADYWGELSVAQHTVKVVTQDSEGESSEVSYTFTKTNNPTVAPKINAPANNARVQNIFYCEFVLGNDIEGDDQKVRVQIANNVQFNNVLKEFTTNFEVYNELTEEWEPHLDNVFTSDYVGKRIRINVDATVNAKQFYLRITSTDTGSQTPTISSVLTLSKGSKLEIQTYPQDYDTQPKKVIVILENMVAEGATAKTYVANNANDELVVWEEYNPTDNGLHVFQNTIKTAEKWGVAVKYEADAGTATGEVSISRIGIGVL